MTDPGSLLDVNVLIALADARHLHHDAAHRWFEKAGTFMTTPLTEVAFVRLMSHPQVGGETTATALDLLRQIRATAGHAFLTDDSSLADPVVDMTSFVGHRQATDLHLVNLAARHGVAFVTFDARLRRSLPESSRRYVHIVDV